MTTPEPQKLNRVAPPPRVSVVMAVYNGARFLGDAVDSVLNQSWTDFEFVIANDGSTDDTSRILASYSDPRIVLVDNHSNLGLTRSLNRCIATSRGQLIARQDADDVSLPERLSCQVAYLDSNPEVGLVGCGSRWVDEKHRFIRDWQPTSDPDEIQALLLWAVPFLHGTFVFRRACLRDLEGGYNEAIPVAQDCDLLLRLSERWELSNVKDILYVYRQHGDTVTSRRRVDQERCLQFARDAAVQRRLTMGMARLRLARDSAPGWTRRADRRWLARRYVLWSQGARMISRSLALRFLVVAAVLDPTTPAIWSYIGGIAARKLHLVYR